MYYLIKETLVPCTKDETKISGLQYVAVLTTAAWNAHNADFNMGIDMELDTTNFHETKSIINTDSLTGTIFRPELSTKIFSPLKYAFALDERGVVLVDDSGEVLEIVKRIAATKKWKLPGLERFLYDLLEQTIFGDLARLERIEYKLTRFESEILKGELDSYSPELQDIRGDLVDLRIHYEQFIELCQELEENEHDFFKEENLRYFHLLTEKASRLQNKVSGQREYVMQLHDLMQTQRDVRQNRIMTVLTVITSIFMPLTLIVGWYGMNFKYMPELDWPHSYPVVMLVSVVIVITCIIWFKKKKWL